MLYAKTFGKFLARSGILTQITGGIVYPDNWRVHLNAPTLGVTEVFSDYSSDFRCIVKSQLKLDLFLPVTEFEDAEVEQAVSSIVSLLENLSIVDIPGDVKLKGYILGIPRHVEEERHHRRSIDVEAWYTR